MAETRREVETHFPPVGKFSNRNIISSLSPPFLTVNLKIYQFGISLEEKKFIAFDRNKSFQVWEESVYTCVYIRMQLATEAEHFQNYKRTSGANKILEIR